jgi:hypothetical protein
MTSMPTIDDRMVVLFRRTGKRRASYRLDRSGRLAGGRVAPQRSSGCTFVNQRCVLPNGALGICDRHLVCQEDPFPGGFSLPHS